MTREPSIRSYRKWYARLLRLYPKPFRERFGEGMTQTFTDLLRARAARGRGLWSTAAWVFLETFAGIIGEQMTVDTPIRRIVRVMLVAAGLLIVPLTASLFVEGWNWGVGGYVFAWVMFTSVGLGYTFIAGRESSIAYKAAVALGALGAFFLIWVNLAVGIIGSEDNSANVMYLGVLLIGLLGLILSRLEPLGMSRTMLAVATAQMLVPVMAILFWNTGGVIAEETFWGHSGAFRVFVLNAAFSTLWLGSALLFRHARGGPGTKLQESPNA